MHPIKIMAVLVLLSQLAAGVTADRVQISSLKGLKKVKVVVELGDYHKAGLTWNEVKNNIDLKVRLARLTIDPQVNEAIYFKCQIFDIAQNMVSYHLELQVLQPGELKRDHAVFTYSPSWSMPLYGTVKKTAARDKITELVNQMINQLLNDCLTANP
jgi:hypothetical protein